MLINATANRELASPHVLLVPCRLFAGRNLPRGWAPRRIFITLHGFLEPSERRVLALRRAIGKAKLPIKRWLGTSQYYAKILLKMQPFEIGHPAEVRKVTCPIFLVLSWISMPVPEEESASPGPVCDRGPGSMRTQGSIAKEM